MGVGRTKISYIVVRGRERDSFSPVQKEGVFLFGQGEREQRVCPLLFHCPGLGEHLTCKSPSLCTLLLFSIVAATVFYLITTSGKLFLSQHMIFAYCASIQRARRRECKHSFTGSTKFGNTIPKPQPSRKLQFGKIHKDLLNHFICISPKHDVENDVTEEFQYDYNNP